MTLREKLICLFFQLDPMGINFDTNGDEYRPEVDTIIPRLSSCQSVEDVLTVVHEEFQKWFTDSGVLVGGEIKPLPANHVARDCAGPRERYREVSVEIWKLLEAGES